MLDSRDFKLSIRRPEAGAAGSRPAHGQVSATYRLWRSTDLAARQAVPGRWRPDDAALVIEPGSAGFFRATLETE